MSSSSPYFGYDSNQNLLFKGSKRLRVGTSSGAYDEPVVEIGADTTQGAFIDLKSTTSQSDFDGRITCSSSSTSTGAGTVTIQANNIKLYNSSIERSIPLIRFFRIQWLNKTGAAIVVNNSGTSRGTFVSQVAWVGSVNAGTWTTNSAVTGISLNSDVIPSYYTQLHVLEKNVANIDSGSGGQQMYKYGTYVYKDESYASQNIAGATFAARTGTNKWIICTYDYDASASKEDILFDVVVMAVSGSDSDMTDYGPNQPNGRVATTIDFGTNPDLLITTYVPPGVTEFTP